MIDRKFYTIHVKCRWQSRVKKSCYRCEYKEQCDKDNKTYSDELEKEVIQMSLSKISSQGENTVPIQEGEAAQK